MKHNFRHTEVPFYEETQLISDCGGTLGVFIGWCIWSLFDPLKKAVIWILAKMFHPSDTKL